MSTVLENVSQRKCSKCSKRPATKGCEIGRCLGCCDSEKCERHKRSKEQAKLKENILAGTTDVQKMAKAVRGKVLKPGRFREPGFVYQGDTVVIWNVREYLSNDKWRDDAIRKSNRRNARLMDSLAGEIPRKPLVISKKRFRKVVEERLKESLKG